MKSLLRATLITFAFSATLPACKGEAEPTAEELAAKLAADLEEAEARIRNGKKDDAEKIYLRIFETDPNHPDALAGMALVRMEERDHETAQVLLQKAIAAGNNEHTTHFYLGESFRLREMYGEAIGPYAKAFELEPENAAYGLAHGVALKKSKKFPEAEKVLREVGELDPNVHFVWTELGDTLRAQNKLEDALKTYMKAQNTYASDKMARAGAAYVYEAKGDNKHALDEWSAYIRMDCCSEFSDTVAKKKIMELKVSAADLEEDGGEAAPDEEAEPAAG